MAWCWSKSRGTRTNEITAIPELLRALALTGNQGNLAEEVEAVFTEPDQVGYEGFAADYLETQEKNHGR